MKKTSIIAVLLCYLLAFIFVGFLGMKLEVTNPVKYVDEIVWDSENFKVGEDSSILKLEKYTSKEDIEANECNAKLIIRKKLGAGVLYNFRFHTIPLTADNTLLSFYMPKNEEATNFEYKVKKEEAGDTVDVTFFRTTTTTLTATSTDGKNLTYTISIIVINM